MKDTCEDTTTHHAYHPLQTYLCTLMPSSFLLEPHCLENEEGIKSRFLCAESKTIQIRHLTIASETLDYIDRLLKERAAIKKKDNQEAMTKHRPAEHSIAKHNTT